MAFPSAIVHRRNRRKLGRGQYPTTPAVTVIVSSTGTTNATLTFSRPVIVRGTIPLAINTLTNVSQAIVSPTQVTQVWSGNVSSKTYTLPANAANVQGSNGGEVAGVSGTFS